MIAGDVSKLSKLGAALRALPVRVATQIAERAAPRLTELARATFDAHETAYGDAWAPSRDGHEVTLRRSGALASQLRFAAVGTRVRAVLGVPYARYQVGRFPVLPPGGAAMPPAWSEALATIADEEIARDLEQVAP